MISKSSEHRMVFLTSDLDTITLEVPFRLCTHEGILKLYHGSSDIEDFIPHLRRFLRSEHYKLCRHGYVELREGEAWVWRLFGRGRPRLKRIQY